MKIIQAETVLLQIPYEIGGGARKIAGQPASGLNILMLRVETEDGLVGWGEGFGHAVAPATKMILDRMIVPQLIGRDASRIDALMSDLTKALHLFGRNGPVIYAPFRPRHRALGPCRQTRANAALQAARRRLPR